MMSQPSIELVIPQNKKSLAYVEWKANPISNLNPVSPRPDLDDLSKIFVAGNYV